MYIAIDESGLMYLYEYRPSIDGDFWFSNPHDFEQVEEGSPLFDLYFKMYSSDWKNSLVTVKLEIGEA